MLLTKIAAPAGILLGCALSNRVSDTRCQSLPLTLAPTGNRKDVYDVCVVGGGIVGVATAREIVNRFPTLKVALVEKESELAHHQTGRVKMSRNLKKK